MMTAEWDKLTANAKCLQTLHPPTSVLCIITAVNCYWAELLQGIIIYVRGGIGLFCKRVLVFHKQNTNTRLIQCILVTEKTAAFIQSKDWKMWYPYVTDASIGRAVLNSFSSLAAVLIDYFYFYKITGITEPYRCRECFREKLGAHNTK